MSKDILQTSYEQIAGTISPDTTLEELTSPDMPTGRIIELLHLFPDQNLADRIWQEAQAIHATYWAENASLRDQYYDAAIRPLEIRETVAAMTPIEHGNIVVDLGAGSGTMTAHNVRQARTKSPNAQIAAILIEQDAHSAKLSTQALANLDGGLYYGQVIEADSLAGLEQIDTPELRRAIEQHQPQNLNFTSFYSVSYQPLKELNFLIEEAFLVGQKLDLPTTFQILMINPDFDTNVLGEIIKNEVAPQLMKELGPEKGRAIMAAAREALPPMVKHGMEIKEICPAYAPETVTDYLQKNGFNVSFESIIYGHSNLLTITRA